jgi:hypothetical protein
MKRLSYRMPRMAVQLTGILWLSYGVLSSRKDGAPLPADMAYLLMSTLILSVFWVLSVIIINAWQSYRTTTKEILHEK